MALSLKKCGVVWCLTFHTRFNTLPPLPRLSFFLVAWLAVFVFFWPREHSDTASQVFTDSTLSSTPPRHVPLRLWSSQRVFFRASQPTADTRRSTQSTLCMQRCVSLHTDAVFIFME